jgi:hypothetical protein
VSTHRPRTEAELIEHVRSVDAPAPPHLHASVNALLAEHAAPTRPHARAARLPSLPRFALPALAAATATALAVVLAVVLGGSGASANATLRAASRLTLSAATLPAPSESAANRATVNAQVDGVSFPYWQESFGWRATGSRVDLIGSRSVRTVFYSDPRGQRIGYAIVGGTPAVGVHGGRVVWQGGSAYRELRLGGEQVVTWLRDGRLCVVSGRGVAAATLLRLASWHDRAGVA